MVGRWTQQRSVALVAGAALASALLLAGVPAAAQPANGGFLGPPSFIGPLSHNVTVPGNGDVNSYGVAVVPTTRGSLVAGDVLVSNFNNALTNIAPGGQQGRGSTLVDISPKGQQRLFAQIPATSAPGRVGLTTALVVLPSGWVIVGSLPTTDGTAATTTNGALSR